MLSVLAHGASVASDPRGRRLQRVVVVAQVATAVALLFGTALFLRTVRRLDATVLGFDPEQLLAFSGGPDTEDIERWNAFMDRLIARVQTLPNVRSAAVAMVRPLNGPIGWDNQPVFPGQPVEDPVHVGAEPAHELPHGVAPLPACSPSPSARSWRSSRSSTPCCCGPLPVTDQQRVAVIWQRDDRRALPIIEVAYGEMEDWRGPVAVLRAARRGRLGELEPGSGRQG